MHTIDSFEVVTLHHNGEVVLTTNYQAELTHQDEARLVARIDGSDLIIEAATPFCIKGVPRKARTYLSLAGHIGFAELIEGNIHRLATLTLKRG